jgi:hypothetical protein
VHSFGPFGTFLAGDLGKEVRRDLRADLPDDGQLTQSDH